MHHSDGNLSILHVTQAARVGGLERVVHALALGHHRRGHRVAVAAIAGPGDLSPFCSPLQEAGIPVDCLEVSKYSVLSERRFIRNICRQHRPSIVHTHGYRPDIVDSSVARRLGIPTVSTEHGTGWGGKRGSIYGRLQLHSLKSFDAVVAVSRPIARMLKQAGIEQERIETIYNAWAGDTSFLPRLPARKHLGLPDDAFVVGWVGRLIEAKGCDVFLNAMADVGKGHVKAAIIGDGPEASNVRQLASSLDISADSLFLGEVVDAASYFRAFDLIVMSSRTEGSPIVLLEAMAAGVPIVATSVGGLPDMVTSEQACLVPTQDSRAIAGAVQDALGDYEPFVARARHAKERLKHMFTMDPWLDKYEALYERVLRMRS